MKILISPAKSLDFETNVETSFTSKPIFADQAHQINDVIKDVSVPDLSSLMSISPKLSELNWSRNQDFKNNTSKEKEAVFAFNGDVYDGIDANTINKSNHEKLQDSLRILSGLYGILKPFDRIKADRLEMGTKISINGSKNLYEFWKENVTNSILEEIKEDDLIVNLASNEYFSVIDKTIISNTIVSPQFKDFKNGKLKIISFYAKKARGLMVRYIVDNNISDYNDLLGFNLDNYAYNESETIDENKPVFTR